MEDFINELLVETGVPKGTDPKVRAELVTQLMDRATDSVNRRVIDAMSDQDAETFDKLLDDKPDDIQAVQQFIDDHVPHKEQIVGAALLEFRALYLGPAA